MNKLTDKTWDVIVIGTGIGGGTFGRAIAEAGYSVLFIEKGPKGARAEEQSLDSDAFDPVARHVRGYWPKPMQAIVNGRTSEFFAPVGSSVGGSSVFYAATLERPERRDLEATKDMPHPTGGWPISYDQFRPYLSAAEQVYHVNGDEDPLYKDGPSTLANPPGISTEDEALLNGFRQSGLHPYRAHMAIRNIPGCKQCLGKKCPHRCKMDGRSAGVEPALETGNAELIDQCEVMFLRGCKDQLTHIEAMRNGQPLTFTARRYVLAAGALSSPRLLLASKSKHWPDGCANSSGMIGRNLMFHLNEIFAVFPKSHSKGQSKAIALRDLYDDMGKRHGMIQAMGIDASYGEIVHYLNNIFDRSFLQKLKFLRQFTRIPAMIAVKIFGHAKVFVGILEDLPYPENRLVPNAIDPEVLSIQYSFASELLQRRKSFRKQIKRAFKGYRSMFLSLQPELNFGHACGTVCFGTDPNKTVLNADCRAHDVNNLFVVDSSFFPTSLGVNPSLTIAANALRVADHIINDLNETQDKTHD